MKKIKNFFKKLISKISNSKPQAVEAIIVSYKALYVLDNILKYTIEAAKLVKLDTESIEKISGYVTKIFGKIQKLIDTLGIEIEFEDEFTAEIDDITQKTLSTRKLNKITDISDVMANYKPAFDKLDTLLK